MDRTTTASRGPIPGRLTLFAQYLQSGKSKHIEQMVTMAKVSPGVQKVRLDVVPYRIGTT